MDHNLLVSELQSLVVETKRRNPEVREAAEQALEILKGTPISRNELAKHADKMLAPVSLGCKTKVGKIIGISISALQRLVSLGGVPTTSLHAVLATLNSVSGQAVDIQLKILQTLLSILTHNLDVHDDVLGNSLLLCFKLQDSRVSVVSSTAAATLRQAVMIVFDRISSDSSDPAVPLTLPTDPPTELTVTPSALDAFNIFSDLCILIAGGSGGLSLWGSGKDDKPKLLKLSSLQRTFGLELVESVLSGYEEAVKKRPELVFLLQNSLDPLLIKLLHDRPSFPIALRVCRLQFLLIRSFVEQLPVQVEGYLTTLIKIGTTEPEDDAKKDGVQPWLRVLALEIFRGICSDGVQLRNIWQHFDQPDGPRLFAKIIAALGRLLNERPVLLGVGSQMNGIGVNIPEGPNPHGGYLDMGIGMMASAASVGITTVGSMIGPGNGGLGSHSGMKLRLIEQHDKAEAPIIPETYVYLLALQSLDSIAECIYVTAGQATEHQVETIGMAESAWPALLAALSYAMGTNLSDSLFCEVLSALQDFTVACGLLGLDTPRNAFLSSLGKYAVPPPAVTAMQSYMDAPNAGRSNSVMGVDALGLGSLNGGSSAGPPSLSERNMACLQSMIVTARILATSLGSAWLEVLEVLQNANFMLGAKRPNATRRPTLASPQIGFPQPKSQSTFDGADGRPDLFESLDAENIQNAINLLFDGSRELEDAAFTTFVTALCQLSSEMIGMDHYSHFIDSLDNTNPPSPKPHGMLPPAEGKRRASGLNISNRIQSGDRSFSLNRLRVVANTNLSRLINRDPSVGWDCITKHLLAVARHFSAPTSLRMQASETLAEVLLGAIRHGREPKTQHQVFDVLVRQVNVMPISNSISTDHDVRSSGYLTLNQILESSGHALEVGWDTIFGMLNNVCKGTEASSMKRSDSSASVSSQARPTTLSRSDANLVRIAFPSLNLICTDFLSSLGPPAMRLCIACLGCFGRQKEDVNITLAAIGLLWNVSDAVQGTDKDLWLYLLTELLELGHDPRLEVRSSAMQTLFRCIDLYGANLSDQLWDDVFWKIVSPLLDAGSSDESSVLALTSVGSIFAAFLPSLVKLDSFERIYKRLLERVEKAWEVENSRCCSAAVKALEKAITGDSIKGQQSEFMLESTWKTVVHLADSLDRGTYTQENLVDFVRIARILHDRMQWETQKIKLLSDIMRGVMSYDRSPEYRPDNDILSPLQSSITSLVGGSDKFGTANVLTDLAEWTSLAYIAPTPKVTYVGLSKWGMPKIKEVLMQAKETRGLYEDGTMESVLSAFALPIKLKYDCPPANRFGNDPPLWRTALATFLPVFEQIMAGLDDSELPSNRFEGLWNQIIDLFAGILLADSSADSGEADEEFVLPLLTRYHLSIACRIGRIPERLIAAYAETLRKASILYRFDVGRVGGTTAPAIPERSERMKYWAFDGLISQATAQAHTKGTRTRDDLGVTKPVTASLLRRIQGSLQSYVEDSRLRGSMPLGRVREEELLYILRHLAMLKIDPEALPEMAGSGVALQAAKSNRAHLFLFYPILLDIAFSRGHMPSMWIFPDEHAAIYSRPGAPERAGEAEVHGVVRHEEEDQALAEEQQGEDTPGAAESTTEEEGRQAEADVPAAKDSVFNARDGADLIEVTARDLAKRCLEIIGEEVGLTLKG